MIVNKVSIWEKYLAQTAQPIRLCLMVTIHFIVVLTDLCQNKLFYQYCCTDLNVGQCDMRVLTRLFMSLSAVK